MAVIVTRSRIFRILCSESGAGVRGPQAEAFHAHPESAGPWPVGASPFRCPDQKRAHAQRMFALAALVAPWHTRGRWPCLKRPSLAPTAHPPSQAPFTSPPAPEPSRAPDNTHAAASRFHRLTRLLPSQRKRPPRARPQWTVRRRDPAQGRGPRPTRAGESSDRTSSPHCLSEIRVWAARALRCPA